MTALEVETCPESICTMYNVHCTNDLFDGLVLPFKGAEVEQPWLVHCTNARINRISCIWSEFRASRLRRLAVSRVPLPEPLSRRFAFPSLTLMPPGGRLRPPPAPCGCRPQIPAMLRTAQGPQPCRCGLSPRTSVLDCGQHGPLAAGRLSRHLIVARHRVSLNPSLCVTVATRRPPGRIRSARCSPGLTTLWRAAASAPVLPSGLRVAPLVTSDGLSETRRQAGQPGLCHGDRVARSGSSESGQQFRPRPHGQNLERKIDDGTGC